MNALSPSASSVKLPDFLVRRFSHPWMPMALFIPLGALIVFLSLYYHPRSLVSTAVLIGVGALSWTLIEYLLHRHIFHLTRIKQPWRELASGMHLAHHKTADTEDLILAPPISSLFFGTLVYFSFVLLTWSFSASALLEAGVFLGYLAYEWAHFSAHRFKPKGRVGKYLKHYHLHHHFKEPHRHFGVTSPLWDYVFQT